LLGNRGTEGFQAPALPRRAETIPIYTGNKAVLNYDRDIINSKQYEGSRRAEPLTP